jgi:hypothetical protein
MDAPLPKGRASPPVSESGFTIGLFERNGLLSTMSGRS